MVHIERLRRCYRTVVLRHVRRGAMPPPSLQVFLARLLAETPNFEISVLLGVALMKLFHDYRGSRLPQLDEYFRQFMAAPNVIPSMHLGLTQYMATDRWSATPEYVELYGSAATIEGSDIPLPDVVSVPPDVYRAFVKTDHEALFARLHAWRRELEEAGPDERQSPEAKDAENDSGGLTRARS
jgi:hypothetical protein